MLKRLGVVLALGAVVTVGSLGAGTLVPSASGVAVCGVERWPVKTLTDPDAGQIDFIPVSTTVDALRTLVRPDSLAERTPPVETTTYRIKARLIEMKLEEDSDVHLVVAQPGKPSHTMIVEFPSYGCTKGALKRGTMRNARSALIRACGRPSSSSFAHVKGTATITGVGFFDFKHHQTGVAPNAIELHPVIGFKLESALCQR